MKKLWLVWVLVLALALLTACGAPAPAPVTEPDDQGAATQTTETQPTDVQSPDDQSTDAQPTPETGGGEAAVPGSGDLVYLLEANEETFGLYPTFDTYNQTDDGLMMFFCSNQPIPDFAFVAAAMDNNGGELSFSVERPLYEMGWLEPDYPLMVQFLPYGDIFSGFGVTFTDPGDGVTQHFYLLQSTGRGEEGDLPMEFVKIY